VNTDIRLRLSFRNHPKTKKLRFKLGPEAVLSFIWLLMFTAESRPDGELDGLDAEDLALAADWSGDPQAFVDTLVQVGYLEQTDDGFRIHDWTNNQPWAAGADERSEKARQAALARWEKKGSTTKKQRVRTKNHATSNGSAMPRAQSSNAPSPSPSPIPKQQQQPKPIVELPEWIDRDTWLEFEQHRREIRYSVNPTAARRILSKLEKYMTEHRVDPNEALGLTIERGYRGVFPEQIKKELERERSQRPTTSNSGTAANRRADAADRIRADLKAVS